MSLNVSLSESLFFSLLVAFVSQCIIFLSFSSCLSSSESCDLYSTGRERGRGEQELHHYQKDRSVDASLVMIAFSFGARLFKQRINSAESCESQGAKAHGADECQCLSLMALNAGKHESSLVILHSK